MRYKVVNTFDNPAPELQSNAESRVDIVEKTLSTGYRGRSRTECRVPTKTISSRSMHNEGPPDGRDFSHSKYEKWQDPLTELSRLANEVE